jgi:UDPglucose 6-dehydrogenase
MTKYASNAMLACRISFINEVATLCEKLGADITEVRRGMGADSRIGYTFLFPGVGYGGSCFPKDVRGLIKTGERAGFAPRLLQAVDAVNVAQRERMIAKILGHFAGDLSGRTVAVWGLAFKPRTDDIREAPSLDIIHALLDGGAKVRVYDPEAMANARGAFGDRVSYGENEYDALKGADALVIATEWNEFRNPDFERMKELMVGRVIFDGRNIYRFETMRREGFVYFGVGTGTGDPLPGP